MNNLKTIFACSALIALTACDMNNNSGNSYQDRMDIAAEWVTAGYTGKACLLYTSPSPRDAHESRMPSSA